MKHPVAKLTKYVSVLRSINPSQAAQIFRCSAAAYTRYQSEDKRSFLFFPQIAGLDQSKVATLNDGGAQLQKDIGILEKSGRKLSEERQLEKLAQWWNSARADAVRDKDPVNNASLYGGKTALQWTALVPLAMAAGYLLLIFYFRGIGGYRQVHIEGVGQEAREVP